MNTHILPNGGVIYSDVVYSPDERLYYVEVCGAVGRGIDIGDPIEAPTYDGCQALLTERLRDMADAR